MKCNKCGHEVSDNSSYCENCGNSLKKKEGLSSFAKTIIIILIITAIIVGLLFLTKYLFFNNNKEDEVVVPEIVEEVKETRPSLTSCKIDEKDVKYTFDIEYQDDGIYVKSMTFYLTLSNDKQLSDDFVKVLESIFKSDGLSFVDKGSSQVITIEISLEDLSTWVTVIDNILDIAKTFGLKLDYLDKIEVILKQFEEVDKIEASKAIELIEKLDAKCETTLVEVE